MDKVQLSQGCRATTKREFTINHKVPKKIPGTQFFTCRRMKGYINLGGPQQLLSAGPLVGNPEP